VSTLVVGVGNTLRGDDGVGARVLELLAGSTLCLRPALGLVPELAADLAPHQRVVFVDADLAAREVCLEPLVAGDRDRLHGFAPATLVSFARTLGFAGEAWVCRVPVSSLEAGAPLTAAALASAEEAARLVRALG
jgi:hydrogenase maturation protease